MPQPPPFSATVALLTISRVWEAALTDALKPLGLTTRKYGLLAHIRGTPGISFSELARRSRITVQSAHTAVAAFAELGWVDDVVGHAGAASRLQISADGEALLVKAGEAVARVDVELSTQHPDLTSAMRAEMARAFEESP